MKIINLTPHDANVNGGTLPRCATPFRLATETIATETVEVEGTAIVLTTQEMIGETPLPEKEEGTLLFVSLAVAQAYPGRDDLVFPTRLIRDENGTVLGADGLSRLA